jgi:rhodanese-related sulfurtransferase
MARKRIEEVLVEARRRLARLTPLQAMAAQREGALLVDTRSVDERVHEGVIPGSLHLPLSVLPWRLDPDCEWRHPEACDLAHHVVLVCADGFSSSLAAAMLQEIGFVRAADMIGGYRAWRSSGLPVSEAPDGLKAPQAAREAAGAVGTTKAHPRLLVEQG